MGRIRALQSLPVVPVLDATMTEEMRPFVAVIPIRAGSKGLPGKNLRLLGGIPLYQHSLNQARAAGASLTVITTDIEEVLEADLGTDVHMHHRPHELCGDEVEMSRVVADVLQHSEFDNGQTVVLLQVTSPLRRPQQIVAAVRQFHSTGQDMVISVCEANRSVLKYGTVDCGIFLPLRSWRDTFSNRQLLPAVYRPNGAIYVFSASWFRTHGDFSAESIGVLLMPEEDSIDIDTIEDFDQCNYIVERREMELG